LDERSLAERFGVSRTLVREVVLGLASMGLLKVMPRVGVVVPKLTIRDLLVLLEMLAELEVACASFAARRMTAGERKTLNAALIACEQAARSGNAKAYEKANAAFHAAIYSGARQIHGLRLRCAGYQRSRFELSGRLERSLEEHRVIVAAIEAGDADAARKAMIEHIAVGGRDFAELVSTLPRALDVGGVVTGGVDALTARDSLRSGRRSVRALRSTLIVHLFAVEDFFNATSPPPRLRDRTLAAGADRSALQESKSRLSRRQALRLCRHDGTVTGRAL